MKEGMWKAITIISVVFLVLIGAKWSPFQNELRTILGLIGPWVSVLVGLFLIHNVLTQAVATVGDIISRIFKIILGILMFIASAVFIFPVMIGNLAMLGGLSLWMFKFHVGPIVLTIFSLLALALVYVYEGKASWTFAKAYLLVFIVIGFTIVLGGYVWDGLTNTHRIDYKLVAGFPSPDPLESIMVKAGDKLVFDAFGAVTKNGKRQSIQGDEADLLPYGGWWKRRGELTFLVGKVNAVGKIVAEEIFGEDMKSGPSTIGSIDIGPYTSGYHLSGEVTVPPGVSGRLLVGFYEFEPDTGFVRLTVRVNPADSKGAEVTRRVLGYEKPLPSKTEWRTLIRVGFGIVSALILGISFYSGGYKKEGALPSLLDGIFVVLFFFVIFLGYEWVVYEDGGARTAWKFIQTVWRR